MFIILFLGKLFVIHCALVFKNMTFYEYFKKKIPIYYPTNPFKKSFCDVYKRIIFTHTKSLLISYLDSIKEAKVCETNNIIINNTKINRLNILNQFDVRKTENIHQRKYKENKRNSNRINNQNKNSEMEVFNSRRSFGRDGEEKKLKDENDEYKSDSKNKTNNLIKELVHNNSNNRYSKFPIQLCLKRNVNSNELNILNDFGAINKTHVKNDNDFDNDIMVTKNIINIRQNQNENKLEKKYKYLMKSSASQIPHIISSYFSETAKSIEENENEKKMNNSMKNVNLDTHESNDNNICIRNIGNYSMDQKKRDYRVPKLKISSLKATPIKNNGTYYFENNDKISNIKIDIDEDKVDNYIDNRIENNEVEEKEFKSDISYQNVNHED
jgi:hypothetical protein